MHEIVTLQLGQTSNYVATHFWNAQEAYFTYGGDEESAVNHDIHWRAGVGADGSETFMPRTVIYDLKGGFGSLKKINALYESQNDGGPETLWNGSPVVHRQDTIQPSTYQEHLDAGLEPPELTTSSVRYWSDFNRVYYHPRSIVQLNDYELNSTLAPFEKWATGGELFASLDKEHDLLDRDLRPFVEEADQLQGLQLVSTFDDAWGGFASQYVERLRDEFGKTAIWVWGLQATHSAIAREKQLSLLANYSRTLTSVYSQASLVVPLALPRTSPYRTALDLTSPWHTSAVLATAIETASLPSRLQDRSNGDTLDTMTDLLNTMGKQTVATLQMSYPNALQEQEYDSRQVERTQKSAANNHGETEEPRYLDLDFAPDTALQKGQRKGHNEHAEPRIFSQLSVTRGETSEEEDYDPELWDQLRHRRQGGPVLRQYHTSCAFPLPSSFPHIFRDEEGLRLKSSGARLATSLTTDTSLSRRLRDLRATVSRSFAIEDRETLGNDLADMADEYHEGWSSGNDVGMDE